MKHRQPSLFQPIHLDCPVCPAKTGKPCLEGEKLRGSFHMSRVVAVWTLGRRRVVGLKYGK